MTEPRSEQPFHDLVAAARECRDLWENVPMPPEYERLVDALASIPETFTEEVERECRESQSTRDGATIPITRDVYTLATPWEDAM